MRKDSKMTIAQVNELKIALRNRKIRHGYTINKRVNRHIITYEVVIHLKNTDTYKEAHENAKLAIRAIRNRYGSKLV